MGSNGMRGSMSMSSGISRVPALRHSSSLFFCSSLSIFHRVKGVRARVGRWCPQRRRGGGVERRQDSHGCPSHFCFRACLHRRRAVALLKRRPWRYSALTRATNAERTVSMPVMVRTAVPATARMSACRSHSPITVVRIPTHSYPLILFLVSLCLHAGSPSVFHSSNAKRN